MANNKGKQFEQKFKLDFKKTVPNCSIDRLYDSVSGFKAISNISDFIAYSYPNIYYIECKSHQGNTFPLTNLSQYDKLLEKVGIKGVRAGAVIWFIDHPECVVYVPISTFTKLKQDNKKSFHVNMIGSEEYPNVKIPSKLRRVFNDSDYSCLLNLPEGW